MLTKKLVLADYTLFRLKYFYQLVFYFNELSIPMMLYTEDPSSTLKQPLLAWWMTLLMLLQPRLRNCSP